MVEKANGRADNRDVKLGKYLFRVGINPANKVTIQPSESFPDTLTVDEAVNLAQALSDVARIACLRGG